MGVFDSVKQKLGFGSNEEQWDENDEYREDDFYEDDDFEEEDDSTPSGRSRDGYGRSYRDNGVGSRRYGSSTVSNGSTFADDDPYIDDTNDLYRHTSEPEFLRNRGELSNAAGAVRTRVSSLMSIDEVRANRPKSSAQTEAYDPYEDYLDSPSGTSVVSARSTLEIIKPHSYNDAESIAFIFKGGSNVAISLRETRPELAKRILDFSFGAVSVVGGTVGKVSDKVFLLSHSDGSLSDEDQRRLRAAGLL